MSGGYYAKDGAAFYVAPTPVKEPSEDMPMICETCLGPNPYTRMTKLPMSHKLCKLTGVPFQGFRWKAGPQGRYKETVISMLVAKERNICQGCLKDLRFDLPAGVRDAMLRNSRNNNNDDSGQELIQMPNSEAGLAHYYQSKFQQNSGNDGYDPSNGQFALQVQQAPATKKLEKFAASMSSTYHSLALNSQGNNNQTAWRNLPKLCSFWLNGTCNRVLKKSCPYRPCCGSYVFPEIAGSDKLIHEKLQQQLKELGPAHVMKHMDKDVKDALRNSLKGNRDEAIRKRVNGDDDLSKKYLAKIQAQTQKIEPPNDPTITTLWIGGVGPDITEDDILGATYGYGHVVSIHIARASKCAFVEYATREMAVYASEQLHNTLMIKGHSLFIKWAKPKTTADSETNSSSSSEYVPLPPPGLENAPVSAYAAPIISEGGNNSSSNSINKKKRSADDNNDDDNDGKNDDNSGTNNSGLENEHVVKRRMGMMKLPSMDPTRLGATIE